MSNETDSPETSAKSGKMRRRILIGAGLLSVIGAVFGAQAIAGSKTMQHMQIAASGEGGWFHGKRHGGHWGGHHNGRHGGRFFDMSDEEMGEKLTRLVKHAAVEIDATPDQQEKIIALVKSAASEIRPLRDEMRAARETARELLLAENVDRAALEKLRADRVAKADKVSRAVIDTVADIAEILTPEQRKTLAERISEMRGKRRGWNRG